MPAMAPITNVKVLSTLFIISNCLKPSSAAYLPSFLWDFSSTLTIFDANSVEFFISFTITAMKLMSVRVNILSLMVIGIYIVAGILSPNNEAIPEFEDLVTPIIDTFRLLFPTASFTFCPRAL